MFLLVSDGAPWIRLECISSTTLRKGVIQLSLSFQKCGHEYHMMQIISFIEAIFLKKFYIFYCSKAVYNCQPQTYFTLRGHIKYIIPATD